MNQFYEFINNPPIQEMVVIAFAGVAAFMIYIICSSELNRIYKAEAIRLLKQVREQRQTLKQYQYFGNAGKQFCQIYERGIAMKMVKYQIIRSMFLRKSKRDQ